MLQHAGERGGAEPPSAQVGTHPHALHLAGGADDRAEIGLERHPAVGVDDAERAPGGEQRLDAAPVGGPARPANGETPSSSVNIAAAAGR